MYATVILNTLQAGIGNGLSYELGAVSCKPGCLVKAPLRRKLIEGIVVEISKEKPEGDYDLKEIASVISEEPILTKREIDIAKEIAGYYLCPLKAALGLWLPGGEWRKLLPEKEEFIRTVGARHALPLRGDKQKVLVEYLDGKDWVRWDEVKEATGVGRDVIKRLVEKEMVEVKSEVCRGLARQAPTDEKIIGTVSLTPRQTAAYKAMKSDPRPSLLFGVTGSGKTEIYAALIRDVIKEGKPAILLLPEILLTENFIERFQKLIDREAIAVVHSRLTPTERRRAWRGCRDGTIKLVIGSRSALFSPLPDCGLILIDEEHEWTYKNEQSPRYHAVKVAEKLINATMQQCSNAKLILGSATPSVESWFKAKRGDYQLIELPERYGNVQLPSVQVVDLGQVEFGRYYPLSPTLINAIRTRLSRHEQVILFLNRRGFATSLLCLECRHRLEDRETNLPLTYHMKGQRPVLLSHHTGEVCEVPSVCPKCSSANLRPVGAGTQKIERLLEELFPEARLLRADADTLKTPEKMRQLLETMKTGKADILLGTQSVVKGLDLPGVSLAAVLLADVGLSLPHFRAGERVFQLLTQLTGRSGRRDHGEVIIQTFRPQALEVELAAAHDVRGYLDRELMERKKVHYPPETEMVRVVFSGADAKEQSKAFVTLLERGLKGRVERPIISRSPSLFGGGKVWYVFLRGKHVREVLKMLPEALGVIDVDPVECA